MSLNIAIGFVTGRKHFQNVLTTYVNNWLEHGLIVDANIRLHLFVAYDLAYTNTEPGNYKNINPEVAKMIDTINFYGRPTIEEEKKQIVEKEILTQKEADFIFGDGYAKKRNAVLYFALKKKMDRLIFLDDDEYPLSVMRNNFGHLVWMGQSVVGTHIKFSAEADITHGHHCGYISPIPFIQFNKIITKQDFKIFISAISNEIVTWESVEENIIQNHGVTYADPEIINKELATEVQEQQGMKFISGANLCFNLKNCSNRLPPFFNPPDARGEDTFMSTALSELKVLKVPVFTFHDGFLQYQRILKGILPVELQPVNATSATVLKRFIAAAIGWVRYKPLMVYITNPDEYHSVIEKMRDDLKQVIPRFNEFFNTEKFCQIEKEMEFYHKNVVKHFDGFTATKKSWRKLSDYLTEH